MVIRIFITGGTFDKEYNELNGQLYFKDTHLPEMLKLGRCKVDVSIRTLMMVDSLEMNEADRNIILENFRRTHGTDAMIATAKALVEGIKNKT
jgi:L-asparaginase